MTEFRMPSLGADMDEGTVVEWLVKPGDRVRRGQIVAVVDTAKAAIEIESFHDGVVEEILVDVGTAVPVGTPLARFAAGDAAAQPPAEAEARATPSGAGPEPAPAPSAVPRATPPVRHLAHQLGVDLDALAGSGADGHVTHDDVLRAARAGSGPAPKGSLAAPAEAGPAGPGEPRLRVTPRARRLAAERGVDLADLAGAAPGPVTGADVTAAAGQPAAEAAAQAAQAAPPEPAEREPSRARAAGDRQAAMRSAIASLMARSNAEIPHYYVTQTMDLAPSLDWLRARNADLPAAHRLLPAVLFLRASVLAAQAVPDLNGHWRDGALHRAEQVDLGVAVATRGGGLVTPAIPDAGSLEVAELMGRLADLVGRARRGRLRQAEMAGASITVSNLGESGPESLHGVIFPPQVALVCVGGIVERPWAVHGMLAVRPTATIVLAADHRASDGRTASAFLAAFGRALENPEEM